MTRQKFLRTIRWVLTAALVLACVLSYHPSVIGSMSDLTQTNLLARPILILSILCFVLTLRRNVLHNRVIRTFMVVYAIVAFELLCFAAFDLFIETRTVPETRTLLIPLVALVVGYNIDLTRRQLTLLFVLYLSATLVVGYLQVAVNVGGFVIEDQLLAAGKNTLGPMIACGVAIALILLRNTQSWVLRALLIASVVLSIALVATIRARTALLCCGLVLMAYWYIIYRRSHRELRLVLLVALLLVGMMIKYTATGSFITEGVDGYLIDSFTQNHDSSNGGLTAYRVQLNIEALEIISDSPFWGRLTHPVDQGWVHNYVLGKLSAYGIVGAFALMYLYFTILFNALRNAMRLDFTNLYTIGFFIVLIPFFISLAEPTFPYEPGTAVFFVFLLYGMGLKFVDCPQPAAPELRLPPVSRRIDLSTGIQH